MKVCRKCGTENEDLAVFCKVCGNTFIQGNGQVSFCQNCGEELVAGATFCRKCGSRIMSASDVKPAAVQPNITQPVQNQAMGMNQSQPKQNQAMGMNQTQPVQRPSVSLNLSQPVQNQMNGTQEKREEEEADFGRTDYITPLPEDMTICYEPKRKNKLQIPNMPQGGTGTEPLSREDRPVQPVVQIPNRPQFAETNQNRRQNITLGYNQAGSNNTNNNSNNNGNRVYLSSPDYQKNPPQNFSNHPTNQYESEVQYKNSYANNTYGNNAYVEDSYTENSYAGDSYTENSYAGDSYTENSYAGDSYIENSYAGDSYTENSYAGDSYTENSFADGYGEQYHNGEYYEEYSEPYEYQYEEESENDFERADKKSGKGMIVLIIIFIITALVAAAGCFLLFSGYFDKDSTKDVTNKTGNEQTISSEESQESQNDPSTNNGGEAVNAGGDGNEATQPEVTDNQQGDQTGQTPIEETPVQSEYMLPESNSRYLTMDDLAGFSADDTRIARNEIYARHGRKFTDEGLQAYFNSKSWYQGTIEPNAFSDSVLNEYEIANRDLIVEYEKKMGYR